MPSNAWTRRRSVQRRPPVCKSKPKPEPSDYPAFIQARWDWTKAPPPAPSTVNTVLGPIANFPIGTNNYPISGFTNQGASYSGSITINATATQTTGQITITSGPYSGSVLVSFLPAWVKGVAYDHTALLGGPPGFTGNMRVKIDP